jgi:capsular polysaccharide transport system permease protein
MSNESLQDDDAGDIVFWEQPSEVSLAPEVVRQATIKILSERIRLLGIDRSGAYEHYNLLLSSGFPIPTYEIAVLDLVKRRLPTLRSYHEIGSGLGTLPFMLAHDGFASVGVERDERRNLTAIAILRALGRELPSIESNCRLIGAPFPDAINDLDVSESMAILTDFVSSQTPGDYIRLCRGLARYRYILLDLQRFCAKRETADEQQKLVQELVSYGLAPCPEVIDLGGWGYYRLFESKFAGERPTVVTEAEELSEVEMKTVSANAAAVAQLPATVDHTEVALRQSSEVVSREQPGAPAHVAPKALPPMPQRGPRRRLGGWLGLSALLVIGIPSLLAVLYYGLMASSQYVTTFQFAVRGPSQAAAGRSSAAALMGPTAMSPDAFVVTDYINSTQALTDVERGIDVRAMFSKPDIDFWARLKPGLSEEELRAYWANMVWAHFDLISGNVSVSVRAFSPQESLRLAQALVTSSDQMFRKLNNQAQQDFVRVAEENVTRAQELLAASRQALYVFREEGGLVDPDKTAQASAAIIDDLRKQLAAAQAQHASIKAQTPNSPLLNSLTSQIAALEGRIRKEEPLGGSKVRSVTAETLAEYQTLELERQAAEKQYTEALSLRSQAYLVAQNQQSYLALFVAPRLAQTSVYPDRLKAIAAVVLGAALAWFMGTLIVYALRDHLM